MVFYKGALSYETLMAMPMDKLIDLNDDAEIYSNGGSENYP